MDDEERDRDGFDGVVLFVGSVVAAIALVVGLLYGFFWLMFDAGS